MLHEILLSLSGHPSSLINKDYSTPSSILSPPEKELLGSLAHLSNLHCKLIAETSAIRKTYTSGIFQAVAIAICSKHLSRFQRRVLEVEDSLLREDAGSTNDYITIPLTALVSQFSGWTRVMEWLQEVVEFIIQEGNSSKRKCSGPMLINYLCEAMQTGYEDIEEAALSLVTAAETAWLKQISVWILYGRLPRFGSEDFFVQPMTNDPQEYEVKRELLPAFVSDSSAGSLLFIGRSLNHIRARRSMGQKLPALGLLQMHLQQLSSLKFPISSANFSRAILSIRLSLSQDTLQSLLPLSKVNGILTLLRELFLLGRGEFAVALVNEADDRMRSRWQQSKNLSYEKREGNLNILLKEGEVSAVLAKTWAILSALQGQHEEYLEDDGTQELARDLVYLTLSKPVIAGNSHQYRSNSTNIYPKISSTPFENLLLSIPTSLTMHIPSPLDLFLTPADIQIYSCINSYLLSIRRAHLRLTNLWKVTAIRRHHPAPHASKYRDFMRLRQKKINKRFSTMRSVWATSSAALFFLAETEAYFQGEVVQSTWAGFKKWIMSEKESQNSTHSRLGTIEINVKDSSSEIEVGATSESNCNQSYDPQSMTDAHQRYLSALATSLLLTIPTFTNALYHLLQKIDYLVALVHRIHSIWQSLDLEDDEGVVDAFSDFRCEEIDVKAQLHTAVVEVKMAIESLVHDLREIDQQKDSRDDGIAEFVLHEEGKYVPATVGRLNRLLMKLDFGDWFDGHKSDHQNDDLSNKSEEEIL